MAMAMAMEQSVMALIRASRPSLRNNNDKIAFAVHAHFLASGYVLNATGPPAFSDDALHSSSTNEVAIDGWNETDDTYAFVYFNPFDGFKKVLVKCLVMFDKLLVDALSCDVSEPVHLQINVGDYVGENGGTNFNSQFKDLGRLLCNLNSQIVAKLNRSSMGSPSPRPSSSGTRQGQRCNPNSVGGFEPQGAQPPSPGLLYPAVYPVAGNAVLPSPPAGAVPTRGDFGSGSGMFVGPKHSMFGGLDIGMGRMPGHSSGLPGVPPGASFDPYGPPGVSGFEPQRFLRNPRMPGGGTHPDLDHYKDGSDFI